MSRMTRFLIGLAILLAGFLYFSGMKPTTNSSIPSSPTKKQLPSPTLPTATDSSQLDQL